MSAEHSHLLLDTSPAIKHPISIDDDSGNKNIGALISDYIVDFDKKTNEPKNKKPNHKHRLGKEGKRKPF